MIERLENHRVLIYSRNADNKNNAWKFEKTFDNFPHDVFTQTKSSLYLFTPDLKRFACLNTNNICVDYRKANSLVSVRNAQWKVVGNIATITFCIRS